MIRQLIMCDSSLVRWRAARLQEHPCRDTELKYRQIKESIALRTEVGGKVAAIGFVGGNVGPLTPA